MVERRRRAGAVDACQYIPAVVQYVVFKIIERNEREGVFSCVIDSVRKLYDIHMQIIYPDETKSMCPWAQNLPFQPPSTTLLTKIMTTTLTMTMLPA
jgi:hypothetical protein